jgi:hypothetical protein
MLALLVPSGTRAASTLPIAFKHYQAPAGFSFAHEAGETSIGVNPVTNNAMFLMSLDTARVHWNDAVNPPAATWTNVSYLPTRVVTLDPILYTDRVTRRTFVNQLIGEASILAYTDDDGGHWTITQPPFAAPSFDHETLGGGTYHAPLATGIGYTNTVYYCAQVGIIQCNRSDDGGLSWSAPIPLNIVEPCGGLHGHLVVNATGTVYLPNRACGDGNLVNNGTMRQGFFYSTDNGLTFKMKIVPGTQAGLSDPGIAFDKGGKMYFVTSSGGKPVVATSSDAGTTWSALTDVGASVGIQNTEFPMVVAGDAGRAAFAFYGTTTAGNDQAAAFTGVWHLYVSSTFDGGTTWTTVDTTPSDPVQRGCIWLQGGGNPCRNLLDFQGMTVDGQGRVLVGYADGCTSAKCIGLTGTPSDSRDSWGTIARQTTGKRLYAAYDP